MPLGRRKLSTSGISGIRRSVRIKMEKYSQRLAMGFGRSSPRSEGNSSDREAHHFSFENLNGACSDTSSPYKYPQTPPRTPNTPSSTPTFPRSSLVTSSARSTCLKRRLGRLDSSDSQNRSSNDKHNEAVVNISAPITNQMTEGASDDDDETDKPQPPARQASLMSPHGHNTPSRNDQQVTIKSGYLKKQNSKKIKIWNERWFVLKGEHVHYYKDTDGKYLGSIFLPGGKVTALPVRSNESQRHLFEITPGSDRLRDHNPETHILSASSATDMDDWIKAVRRVILSPFGGGIFGQSLAETMQYDSRHDLTSGRLVSSDQGAPRRVPIIVEKCIEFIRSNNGLTEEGLFRLPGETNEVKELQDAFDMGERPVFPKTTDVHTVASLLKGYLRELPEPVVPFESYEHLISAAKLSQNEGSCQSNTAAEADLATNEEEVKQIIKDQLTRIPQENFHLLGYLCHFLDEVQQHSSQNKMDISNLSMVFGPNIMRAKSGDALSMMADTNNVQHTIFLFISNHLFFFPEAETSTRLSFPFTPDLVQDETVVSKTKVYDAENHGVKNATDDSGTGSMVPTPESTHKRAPPIPAVPPPIRNKPYKGLRRKQSGQLETHETIVSPSDRDRRSNYDNSASTLTSSSEMNSNKMIDSQTNSRWRQGVAGDETCNEQLPGRTRQQLHSVSTVPDATLPLTRVGAENVASPDSDLSQPFENVVSSQYPAHSRTKRPKPVRYISQNATDEESNTESVPPEEHAISTRSSLRGDLLANSESSSMRNHPRSSSYPVTKYATTGRNNPLVGVQQGVNRRSLASESDGLSSSAIPTVPLRNHRKLKKDVQGQLPESHQQTPNSVDFSGDSTHVIPERLSTMTSATAASDGGRPLSYKEMEQQILMLKNELQNQRLEHEKRSRMLEEHYVMKMKSSTSGSAFSTPPVASSCSYGRPIVPSKPSFLPRSSIGEDSTLGSKEETSLEKMPSRARTASTESQPDIRYKEEVKRHEITKIKLGNAQIGLRHAEERNRELQKEMERFFNAFGGAPDVDDA